jgi:hypothetical protein
MQHTCDSSAQQPYAVHQHDGRGQGGQGIVGQTNQRPAEIAQRRARAQDSTEAAVHRGGRQEAREGGGEGHRMRHSTGQADELQGNQREGGRKGERYGYLTVPRWLTGMTSAVRPQYGATVTAHMCVCDEPLYTLHVDKPTRTTQAKRKTHTCHGKKKLDCHEHNSEAGQRQRCGGETPYAYE